MKFQKKPPLTSREIQALILIGVVAAAVLGVLVWSDIRLARLIPGGGGFVAAWEGSKAYLSRSDGPYDPAVARRVQDQVYGRPAGAGENPYFLGIPFFLLPAFFPFAFLPDLATARGIWLFINQAALAATAFLTLRLIEWRPARLFLAGYALLSVFGLYSILALLEGGPAGLLGLLYVSILLAYYTEQDELAGALLAVACFAWEIGLLFIVLCLWKAWNEKRAKLLAGFGMSLVILLTISLLLYPGWVFTYLITSLASLRAMFGITAPAALTRLEPVYGRAASQALAILLSCLLLYEWSATRGRDPRRFVWAACLTLAVTPLLGLRSDPGNLVVLTPSLALVFAATASRWRGGYWLATLLLLIAFLVPWALYLRWQWLHDVRNLDHLFLFAPLTTALGLYWTRWWFLRPPRTWLDYMRTTLNAGRRPATDHSTGSLN